MLMLNTAMKLTLTNHEAVVLAWPPGNVGSGLLTDGLGSNQALGEVWRPIPGVYIGAGGGRLACCQIHPELQSAWTQCRT